jgi:hypothetical protein
LRINLIFAILISLFTLPFVSKAQDDELIEESPKYVSKAERDHYNKRDQTGKRVGTWKIFNRERVMISEIEYDRDLKHGKCIKYHSVTGKPLEEKNYVYGKLDGPYQKYTATGQLLVEGEYTDGKKSGVWTFNYTSGTIRSTGSYVNGLKEGKWEFFNRKEELKKSIEYKGGKSPDQLAPPPSPPKPKEGDKKKVVKKPSSTPASAPTPDPASTPAPAPATPTK